MKFKNGVPVISKKHYKALCKSVKKWERILNGKDVDRAGKNCELCKRSDTDCNGCVVAYFDWNDSQILHVPDPVHSGCRNLGYSKWVAVANTRISRDCSHFIYTINKQAYPYAVQIYDRLYAIMMTVEVENGR